MFETQATQQIYNTILSRGRRSVPTYAEVKRDARETSIESLTLNVF